MVPVSKASRGCTLVHIMTRRRLTSRRRLRMRSRVSLYSTSLKGGMRASVDLFLFSQGSFSGCTGLFWHAYLRSCSMLRKKSVFFCVRGMSGDAHGISSSALSNVLTVCAEEMRVGNTSVM
jgi:hypothetical protein